MALETEAELALTSDAPLLDGPPPGSLLAPFNKVCPVSGSPVNAKYSVVYDGRVVGFCCPNCPKSFLGRPRRPASRTSRTRRTSSRAAEPGSNGTPPPCGTPEEGLVRLFEETDLLVLGELHGTHEIPAFALEAVCAALGGGRPVVLGLELGRSEQATLDAYLASPAGPDDVQRLTTGGLWELVSDGRTGEATVTLIESARQLIAAGADLSVLYFDDVDASSAAERDRAMAAHILEHRSEHSGATYVVLVGNVHAMTETGVPWDPDFEPMSSHLAAAVPTMRSLNARYSGGEAWNCQDDGCGVHPVGGSGSPGDRGVELFAERDEHGYDGVFDVGEVTASLPVVD